MNKKIKAAIFAAAFISLGGAAYTYNQYGVQDNSMLLANVEAMTCDDEAELKAELGGKSGGTRYHACFATWSDGIEQSTEQFICASGTSLFSPNNCPNVEEGATSYTGGAAYKCGNKAKPVFPADLDYIEDAYMGVCYE